MAYASTIHKLQGITVGEGKDIKRVVMYPPSKTTEMRSPGLTYVLFSRPKLIRDMCVGGENALFDEQFVGLSRRQEEIQELVRTKQLEEKCQELYGACQGMEAYRQALREMRERSVYGRRWVGH